jgi:signal transduction histidine kinase
MTSPLSHPATPHTTTSTTRPRIRKIITGPLPTIITGPLPSTEAASEPMVGAVAVAMPGEGGWEIVIPEMVLQKIVLSASRALQVDRCSLALFDAAAGELVTLAAIPTPRGDLRRSRFRPGEGIAGEVARTGEPLIIDDVEHDPRFKRLGRDSIRALICAPLLDSARVLGTMTATSSRPGAFSNSQLDLFTIFAEQAALAIAQARRAEEVDRLKSAFLSTVSHELRTPLNSIRGFVEIILSGRTGPLSPLQQDFLQSVQESTKQLHRLVEDIMQLSLAEAGKLRLECVPTDMNDLAMRVARQMRPQAEASGVTLELALNGTLPEIECDPARVEQMLANLIGNAIKFTPTGGLIHIGSSHERDGVRLSIRDTGPGISDDEQRKVFDRLYQVQHGLNRGYGGAGLGLTIVKHLVEGHGGRIDLVSQVGQGSTFSVWLPRRFSPRPND